MTKLLGFTACFLVGGIAFANPPFNVMSSIDCEQLVYEQLVGIKVDSATPIDANDDLPSHCYVTGIIQPGIGFAMRMPLKAWNTRLLVSGCGAFCGQVLADAPGYSNSINFAVRRGYSAITTDSGHQGESSLDTNWAYNNALGEVLYAHAWVPLAASAARRIVQAAYQRQPEWAYFSGCSNGGRTAAKVAQLYPQLFDGIASGAPGLNATFAAGVLGVWLERTLFDSDGHLRLAPHRAELVSRSVLAQCDALDGIEDGIVSQPAACQLDLTQLRCKHGGMEDNCLSDAELDVVSSLYAGAKTSEGKQVYVGVTVGSERYWSRWLLGSDGSGRPHIADMGTNFLRHLGLPQDPSPDYTPTSFSFDDDIELLSVKGELFNATNADLEPLEKSGAKLLMYHGWADSLTPPHESIEYYEAVIDATGTLEQTKGFFRLFLVPGMDHCWGVTGLAPDMFDPLKVLKRWVENNEPPSYIIAKQHAQIGARDARGNVVRTRRLCPYPAHPVYVGTGDPDRAENFTCIVQ